MFKTLLYLRFFFFHTPPLNAIINIDDLTQLKGYKHYHIGGVLLVFLISNKTLTLVIALGNPH